MNKAVLLITFNRKEYLAQVFAAVAREKPPRLYISSDGARKSKLGEQEVVDDIRKWMLKQVSWPCEVKTRYLNENSGGCGPGVSGAVTWFFNNEKEGIVLEDDCVPTHSFFKYCEECLDLYATDKRVWHIAGSAPIDVEIPESYYFSKTMHCWGWAGWADRWAHFNIHECMYSDEVYKKTSKDLRVQAFWRRMMAACANGFDTWDYQWIMKIISMDGLCVTPAHSLVRNIGSVGCHYEGGATTALKSKIREIENIIHPKEVRLDVKRSEQIMQNVFCPRNIWPIEVLQWLFKLIFPEKIVDRMRGIKRIVMKFI